MPIFLVISRDGVTVARHTLIELNELADFIDMCRKSHKHLARKYLQHIENEKLRKQLLAEAKDDMRNLTGLGRKKSRQYDWVEEAQRDIFDDLPGIEEDVYG